MWTILNLRINARYIHFSILAGAGYGHITGYWKGIIYKINAWSPTCTTQKFWLQNKLFQEGTLTIWNLFCCNICCILYCHFPILLYKNISTQSGDASRYSNKFGQASRDFRSQFDISKKLYFAFSPFLLFCLHMPFKWEVKDFVSLKIDEL